MDENRRYFLSNSTPIVCVGKDKVRRSFYYHVEERRDELFVTVRLADDPDDDEVFDWTLEIVDDTTLRSVSINAFGYSKMGLPDAIIPKIALQYGRRIISSSARKPTSANERRSESGHSMWTRMKREGKASYDDGLDIFEYPAKPD